MSQSSLSRRDFLRTTAAVSAGGVFVPYWANSVLAQAEEPTAKTDRFRLALIGAGIRGLQIARQATRFGDFVAIADVDLNHAERAKAKLGGKADIYRDYRKLLERQDIDVVFNATPDHWHTAINVDACKSGKDVYTEKPLTLTIDEGKILRRVVDETKRVVQVGTQQRSMKCFQTAVELVRNGRIGKLQSVTVALPFRSLKGGPFPTKPVPPQLDWDIYQGQAPLHDYCPERTHYNFRFWWEYAGGDVTNWGNHHQDIAHWGIDQELSGPVAIEGTGNFPNAGKPNCYNNLDHYTVNMVYPNGIRLLFESSEKKRNGITFLGDTGRIFVNRSGVRGKPVEELPENPLPGDAWRARPSDNHMANFFHCVRTREEPVAPVRIEHRTVTACHLANIAIRLKRKLTWDPVKEEIVGDDEANAWQKRKQRAPWLVCG